MRFYGNEYWIRSFQVDDLELRPPLSGDTNKDYHTPGELWTFDIQPTDDCQSFSSQLIKTVVFKSALRKFSVFY